MTKKLFDESNDTISFAVVTKNCKNYLITRKMHFNTVYIPHCSRPISGCWLTSPNMFCNMFGVLLLKVTINLFLRL